MELFQTIISGLFGLAIGSFLNVCIDRLPVGKSLIYPPSYCEGCQRRISPKELIPVFSYLWLRGRCRYCSTKIPIRVLLVELATALVFALLYRYYGLSIDLGLSAFYFCLFGVLAVIDLEHGLILNKITYPASIIAIIIDIFISPNWLFRGNVFSSGVVSGLIGMATGIVFLLVPTIIYFILRKKEGMGIGDIKMAGLIGLVTGFPMVMLAIFLGALLGGVFAISQIILEKKGWKDPIPYGDFLSLGTVATILWGNAILDWYLGLLL